MTTSMADWFERYSKFKDTRWSLNPSSYQIRNPDGSAGGWIAQVQIWHDVSDSTTVQKLMEKLVKIYESQDEANAVAFVMGVTWLEKHAI